MPNTVYGPFTAINVLNGSTPANATWGNLVQTQSSVALNGFNPDFCGPFVLTGITCTKDGTNANQLDIASGTAYVKMSDGTTGKIAVGADNTHTTATPSTTYYLFLCNDGTWQWGTTSTGPTNSLPICQATTDGSGNILAVTDVRHTAGSPGIPYVIARVMHQNITATTVQNVLLANVPVTGLYRANLYFFYSNGTPQKVIANTTFFDPDVGGGAPSYFMAMNSAAPGMILNGSQASTTGNNQGVGCAPLTMYAQAGQNCVVQFRDPGGTPNDRVSVVVERIG